MIPHMKAKLIFIRMKQKKIKKTKIKTYFKGKLDIGGIFGFLFLTKGQLISKCLFEQIVWTKIPTKNLIDSAHYTSWAESIKFFVGILAQTIFSKRHFEIN